MAHTISDFTFKHGISIRGISKVARRFESLHEFKVHAITESNAMFDKPGWEDATAAPLDHGLVCDDATCYIDDGDLQNWLNLMFDRCGIPLTATEMEDKGCFYDRRGCWWKVRTFLLAHEDSEPWTTREAALAFTTEQNARARSGRPTSALDTKVAPATQRELERIPYRMTVEWRVCPGDAPPDSGGDSPQT